MTEFRIWNGSTFVSVTDEQHRVAGDPHTQYHTDARGDARYDPIGAADDAQAAAIAAAATDASTKADAKVTANVGITGATKTKITYDAKGLVTSGADATTADIASSTNKRYVTDAQLVVVGNTSGTNTGDQDLSSYATTAAIAAAYQPIDATLTALAGANWAANSLPIGSGADALSQVSFAANTFPARASSGNLVAKTISDDALAFVAAANNGSMRTALGLGSLATQSGTFSGTSSGTNTGDQTSVSGSSGSCTGNAATVTTNANLTGHVTSTGNATVLGSFTVAQLNAAVSDADVAVTTAANSMTAVSTPSAPAAGSLQNYSKVFCGREMPFVLGPNGIERCEEMPEITGWHGWYKGFGSAAGTYVGFAGTNTVTPVQTGPTLTNCFTLMHRSTFSSVVTTQNQQIGMRPTFLTLFRGNAAGLGGFWIVARFGFTTIKTGSRLFCGVSSTTNNVNVDPSGLTNIAAFAFDIGDTAITFMHNDASGTATKTAIAGQATLATNNTGYIAVIGCYPNDSKIYYALYDLIQGVWLCDTSVNSDLPVNTTALGFNLAMSNGTANTAANDAQLGISTIDIYTES